MGEIGIERTTALFELKLWEIHAIVDGYRRRARNLWEATRWQTFHILAALGCKLRKPEELQRFPWEIDMEDLPTRDEVEELREDLKNWNKNG